MSEARQIKLAVGQIWQEICGTDRVPHREILEIKEKHVVTETVLTFHTAYIERERFEKGRFRLIAAMRKEN